MACSCRHVVVKAKGTVDGFGFDTRCVFYVMSSYTQCGSLHKEGLV